MENNSLFPLKYRLRKTDELVEIVAWETADKGARSESDWVSYIDANGNEHVKEHLTLEWDFVIQTPFEKGFMDAFTTDLPKFDVWESRRYELAKYFFEDGVHNYDKAVEYADEFIAAFKKVPEAKGEKYKNAPEAKGEEYENIGVGEIVWEIEGLEHLKRFVFTDRKDIVGFRGDNGRWAVGDRVKVYIKRLEPQEEERPVP